MARKFSSKLKSIMIFALVIGGSWAISSWWGNDEMIVINGKMVQVIDGDSFKDQDDEYRVYGIDAPEYRQVCKDAIGRDWSCGKSARRALEQVLRKGSYECDVYARDQYGRIIVTCTGNEQDLGAFMVAQGYAVSAVNFADPIYGAEEMRAEKAKRGIWQGTFEKPSSWRAAHPR